MLDHHGSESALVAVDGRIDIRVTRKHLKLKKLILSRLHAEPELPISHVPSSEPHAPYPRLNVVIQVVGSRGDIQPFVAFAKHLKDNYGHRVRLATHAMFKSLVEDHGIEFFNIGGDPAGLMSYMVKNPSLIPTRATLKGADIAARKTDIASILSGCWRSCIESGNGMDDEEASSPHTSAQPFIADAIIANPPSFAHIHCAEKLGIPFHIMFTMPWTPTRAFPHPLANIYSTQSDTPLANFLSFPLVTILTWQGLGSTINHFRCQVLKLEPVSIMWTPILCSKIDVPFTYCFSPALLPKPSDWASNVTVAGFWPLDLATHYEVDPELQRFINAGPPPLYCGFGSIVVEDPKVFTKIILEAVRITGSRAVISHGWAGFDRGDDASDDVLFIGNVPHDWLFPKVSLTIHHGGAGTTAAAISAGRPSIIVPFFGDQAFWGKVVAKSGAGPAPIPAKQLNATNLAAAIRFCGRAETLAAAQTLAEKMAHEDGLNKGARSFHDYLPLDRMRCSIEPTTPAAWRVRNTDVRLSAYACAVLHSERLLDLHALEVNRPCEFDLSHQPWDPVSGAVTAVLGTFASLMMGTADLSNGFTHVKKSSTSSSSHPAPETSIVATKVARIALDLASQIVSLSAGSGVNREHAPSASRHDMRRTVNSIISFPREFVLGLSRGFHNAPRIYHDRTVRRPGKVTNLKSGLASAGKGFGLDIFDALFGLLAQPFYGAKESGTSGFIKGIGKGIGGLLLKPEAAVFGAIGYTLEGLHHEIHRHSTTIEYGVAVTRIQEGLDALADSSMDRRLQIVAEWSRMVACDGHLAKLTMRGLPKATVEGS